MAEDIIKEAVDFFAEAQAAEEDNRTAGLYADSFDDGEGQWSESDRQLRQFHGKPCLTLNRIPTFVNQVVNDQRQIKMSMKALPVDDFSDVDTAEQLQGIFRNIEANSDGPSLYSDALESAVRNGLGYIQIALDWAGWDSFEKDIFIKPVYSRYAVHWDPASYERDGSDADRCLVSECFTEAEYRKRYPKTELANSQTFVGTGDDRWIGYADKQYRVSHFWKREYEDIKIQQIRHLDGRIRVVPYEIDKVTADEWARTGSSRQEWQILQERKSKKPKASCYIINGREVIKSYEDYPGLWIPVVPVYGNLKIVNAEKRITGIVKNAIEAQRMYNYWMTAATVMISLATKAPWVMAEGQDEGHEEEINNAHLTDPSVIHYKPVTVDGKLAERPTRDIYEPPVQGILQMAMHAEQNLKAITGLYDPSLGNRVADQSGIAIRSLQQQGDRGNAHFVDNLRRSGRHVARIVLDLIPYAYPAGRRARILGEDGTHTMQEITSDTGKYDVVMTTGPSYQTVRQEKSQMLVDMSKNDPGLMQTAPDLVYRSLDVPGAQEIADRRAAVLPPELTGKGKDGKPLPPEAIQQIRQLNMKNQQLEKMLQVAQEKLSELEREKQGKVVEMQGRKEIEVLKATLEAEKLTTQEQIALLKEEMELIRANIAGQQAMAAQAQQPQNGAGG